MFGKKKTGAAANTAAAPKPSAEGDTPEEEEEKRAGEGEEEQPKDDEKPEGEGDDEKPEGEGDDEKPEGEGDDDEEQAGTVDAKTAQTIIGLKEAAGHPRLAQALAFGGADVTTAKACLKAAAQDGAGTGQLRSQMGEKPQHQVGDGNAAGGKDGDVAARMMGFSRHKRRA